MDKNLHLANFLQNMLGNDKGEWLKVAEVLRDDGHFDSTVLEIEAHIREKATELKAFHVALKAHEGQEDKAGKPYILHPVWLYNYLNGEDQHKARVVALLHDVVEDTPVTLEQLWAKGFDDDVVEAVGVLTRTKDVEYLDYVRNVNKYPLAREVKLADLAHHFARSDSLASHLRERYVKAQAILDSTTTL